MCDASPIVRERWCNWRRVKGRRLPTKVVVDTEHLLLALAKEMGAAGHVLRDLGADVPRIREQIKKFVLVDPGSSAAQPLVASECLRRIFDDSRQVARDINHNYVGTEHLLLALV